ncbi:MAG: hypothetical protein ACE145_11330 [Terriglobia bacterium]
MRVSFLPVLFITCCLMPLELAAQQNRLPASDFHDFLTRYSQGLQPLDKLYLEIKDEDFSMLDERNQPMARRPIEDRQRALNDLRESVRGLDSSPQDLVLAIRVFLQGESLADDLFDLSQIAYDNDREELGKEFADLLGITDRHNSLLESYLLELAAGRQQIIQTLQKENAELRKRLREATEKPGAKKASHAGSGGVDRPGTLSNLLPLPTIPWACGSLVDS